MQVDPQGLTEAVKAKIGETQQKLSSTRRKRPVPEDWATNDTVAEFDVKSSIDTQFTGAQALAVDSSGDLFITGDSDGAVGVYDLKQNAFVTRSNLQAGAILDAAWARDSAVVATANGAIVVTNEGTVSAQFHQHAGAATSLAVHPTGDIVASVGVDKSYVLYDLHSSTVMTQVFSDTGLTAVAFHPDGHLLAAGSQDGTIKLYSVITSDLAHTFPASTPGPIKALDFSENGTWLCSAQDGSTTVTVWDLRKLSVLVSQDIETAVSAISLDYTGQYLAVCGPGGVVVKSYDKKSKKWTEPLRKAVSAVNVRWGAQANTLVTLTADGAISLLGA